MIDSVSVALWATNLSIPLNGIEAWAARIEDKMVEAKAQGADLLVMPEYAAEQWLTFAPEGMTLDQEVPWLARQAPAALEAIRALPAKHGMALLAGTMPVLDPDAAADAGAPGSEAPRYLNRAWLLLPDGREIAQDKVCLTPGEKDPAGWNLSTGESIQIVEWHGLRLATLICLDIELPALSGLLGTSDLDLILVPSMTEKPSGNARVFSCAKARAVELQAAVCAVGAMGKGSPVKARASNTSGAAAFVPCEEVLGHDGVHAQIPQRQDAEGPGPLLIARDLPLAEIRRLRHGGAEVWPGAWRGENVQLVEHAETPQKETV